MLHLILGTAGSGKTHWIYDRLQSLPPETEALLLVPEQFSFESERTMLSLPKPRRAEVLSFSRLCDRVFKRYGGIAGTPLGDGEKLLLVARAVRQTKEQLQIYRRQVRNVDFYRHVLSVITECKYSGISPARLMEASVRLPEGTLRKKLRELAAIAAAYEALVAASYIDPEDQLERLYDLLEEHPFWQNKTVFIDSFKDFTAPQKKLLAQMFGKARDVYLTLCADGLSIRHNLELFANTKGLAADCIRMANQQGVPVGAPVVLTQNRRAATDGLAAMEAILAGRDSLYTDSCNEITICSNTDRYDESEYVASAICRLTREEGYRYRDITVIARDPSLYDGILDAAFERYGIPYFSDRRRPLSHQPLTAFALKAMEIASKGWDSDTLLSLLKTGLAGLTADQIAQLENYVFTWNIRGSDWLRSFDHHPDGTGAGQPQAAVTDRLNRLREHIVQPLSALRESCRTKTTCQGFATALYDLITRMKVFDALTALARQLAADGHAFEGEDVARSYELFIGVLDQMVRTLGNAPLTAGEFTELMQITLAGTDMGKIPQGIDQVVIGAADRTRPARPKAVFLLGANQGSFPAVPASGGLLTDRDRMALNQVDLPLSDHCEFDTVEEQFLFYNAACQAEERVYFTYLTAAGGQPLSPSMPVMTLCRAMPGCRCLAGEEEARQNPLSRIHAVGPALELLARRSGQNDPFTGSLFAYFQEHHPKTLALLQQALSPPCCTLSRENAQTLFGRDMTISPSGVEVYHKCRFFYFCRYGLRVQPRLPVGLDVLSRGTLIHYVLEHMLKRHGSKGLSCLSAGQMQSNIHSMLLQYVEEEMGGLEEKPPTFRFRLTRIEALLVSLLTHMAAEMQNSEFVTAACELNISKQGEVSPMTIALPQGGTLSVVGVVDRLDTFVRDGITYFRVVDYKTGIKTFSLHDIYYGIGLQMLIYLYSIEENGIQFGEHRYPAGILYMPARRTSVAETKEEEREKELAKALRMKGLILDAPEVLHAMDPAMSGLYLPLSFNKNGTPCVSHSLASLEFFGKTHQAIRQLLYEMGACLQRGEITCDPLDPAGSDEDACRYCDYQSACPLGGEGIHRKVPKLTGAQVNQLLKGGAHHELSGNRQSTAGH